MLMVVMVPRAYTLRILDNQVSNDSVYVDGRSRGLALVSCRATDGDGRRWCHNLIK